MRWTAAAVESVLELDRLTQPLDLEAPVGGDGEVTLADQIADRAANPEELALVRDMQAEILQRLEELPRRQRVVVSRRFGLGGEPPETHAAVATELGVSRARVRQLELEALSALRVAIGLVRPVKPRRACAHCGEVFRPRNHAARFCSRRCRARAESAKRRRVDG